MSNKRRTPTEKELSLWREMMQEVEPLHDATTQKSEDTVEETVPLKIKQGKIRNTIPEAQSQIPAVVHPKGAEKHLDRRTDEKLRKGKMPIEATLDLHGMTQNQAYTCLKQFVLRSYNEGKRCILVITGKGSRQSGDNYIVSERSEKGVLRARLPEWLKQEPLDDIVLKSVMAHKKHGGGGFYVYLKNRNKNY